MRTIVDVDVSGQSIINCGLCFRIRKEIDQVVHGWGSLNFLHVLLHQLLGKCKRHSALNQVIDGLMDWVDLSNSWVEELFDVIKSDAVKSVRLFHHHFHALVQNEWCLLKFFKHGQTFGIQISDAVNLLEKRKKLLERRSHICLGCWVGRTK